MTNPNFLKINASNVEFRYPKLDATYRFNSAERRSEKCLPTAQGASWSISWSMPKDKGAAMVELLKRHYETCRANDKTLPAFSRIFGSKEDIDGSYTFTAKRKGVDAKGQTKAAPKVVDAKKQPLQDLEIWSGSTGNIIAVAYPTKAPDGTGGISIMLDAVQVVNPIYGSDGLGDFKDESEQVTAVAESSGDW